MASLLPSMKRSALKAPNCATSSLLRPTPPARNFTDTAGPSQPKHQSDSLLKGKVDSKNDPSRYAAKYDRLPSPALKAELGKIIAGRARKLDTLRKLVAVGVVDLPKPLEEMSGDEQEQVLQHANKVMRLANVKLPSGEKRDRPPNPKLIAKCEQLCELLDIPLPFDKNTANAGEVSDALLRLEKRRYYEEPEVLKALQVTELEKDLLPTDEMMRMAERLGVTYSRISPRGELAERLRERWKERRAARGYSEQPGGKETQTNASS